MVGDQGGGDEVGVEDAGEGHPAEGDLLDDAGVGEDVEPQAAEINRDGHAEQTHGLHLLDQRLRVRVGVLVVRRDRQHLFGDEGADGVDELVGEAGVGRHQTGS